MLFFSKALAHRDPRGIRRELSPGLKRRNLARQTPAFNHSDETWSPWMSKGDHITNNTRRPRWKHAGMGRENDWRFSNGLWSSVFKYDYINLMFGEGGLSVDLRGKTVSCRPIVFSLFSVHTQRFAKQRHFTLPTMDCKTDHVNYCFVLLLNLGWNRKMLLIFRPYLYSYLL